VKWFATGSVPWEGRLTEANFFVESNATGLFLGQNFFGGKEDALLLLEGFLGLKISHL